MFGLWRSGSPSLPFNGKGTPPSIRTDGIIPFSMELIFLHLHGRKFSVRHLDTDFISVGIQLCFDMQAGLSPCVPDQVDDHGATQQGLATPILCDMTKHPVFDLVPLTRAGREVADRDPQTD